MRTRDSMACALAYAIWDHAEQVALADPSDPPSLITICFKWATVEMGHTHVVPWEGLLAQVSDE